MKGGVLLSNCRFFFLLTKQVIHWRNTHFAQKASLYALIPLVDIQLTRIRYRGANKLEITVKFFKMSRFLLRLNIFWKSPSNLALYSFLQDIFCFTELRYCRNVKWRAKFTFQFCTRTEFKHRVMGSDIRLARSRTQVTKKCIFCSRKV